MKLHSKRLFWISFTAWFAISIIFLGLTVYKLQRNVIVYTKNAVTYQVQNFLSVGDTFQLEKLTSSLILGQELSGAWVFTKKERMVAGDKRGYLEKIGDPKLHRGSLFIWKNGLPELVYSVPVPSRQGATIGFIVLSKEIPLIDALFFILPAFITFLISNFITIFQANKYANYIGSPIIQLAQKIHTYSDFKKANSDLNITSSIRFAEIDQVEKHFDDLMVKLAQSHKEMMSLTKEAAVARTIQMLAHDVRKPFTLMRLTLSLLKKAPDIKSVNEVLKFSSPDIEKALERVNGMLQDVMEIGASENLVRKEISPQDLLQTALYDALKLAPDAQVKISYNFGHVHKLSVDVHKSLRVFANIIGNALEATRGRTSLWFKTKEAITENYSSMLQICIGNSGSFIEEALHNKLFEAFFTKNKAGGNGLGLAIAHKIVSLHGGKIWCSSGKNSEHPEGFVEFYLELPCAPSRCDSQIALPPSSIGFQNLVIQSPGHITVDSSVTDVQLQVATDNISEFVKVSKRPLRVLILDDEVVYSRGLQELVHSCPRLSTLVSISITASSSRALEIAQSAAHDICILDVDLGLDARNGFEVCSDLRKLAFKGKICIHTDRTSTKDNQQALTSGADYFLPKPMTKAHLVKILQHATEHH